MRDGCTDAESATQRWSFRAAPAAEELSRGNGVDQFSVIGHQWRRIRPPHCYSEALEVTTAASVTLRRPHGLSRSLLFICSPHFRQRCLCPVLSGGAPNSDSHTQTCFFHVPHLTTHLFPSSSQPGAKHCLLWVSPAGPRRRAGMPSTKPSSSPERS